jgi:hypothetical protein
VNPWIVVWLVVAIVTTVALIAFVVALGRHTMILFRTVRRFQEEIQPVAEEIAGTAARAADHASSIQPPHHDERRPGR